MAYGAKQFSLSYLIYDQIFRELHVWELINDFGYIITFQRIQSKKKGAPLKKIRNATIIFEDIYSAIKKECLIFL